MNKKLNEGEMEENESEKESLIKQILAVSTQNNIMNEDIEEKKKLCYEKLKMRGLEKKSLSKEIVEQEERKRELTYIRQMKKIYGEKCKVRLRSTQKAYGRLLGLYKEINEERFHRLSKGEDVHLTSSSNFGKGRHTVSRIFDLSRSSSLHSSFKTAHSHFMKGRKKVGKSNVFPYKVIMEWGKGDFLEWLDEIQLFSDFYRKFQHAKLDNFDDFLQVTKTKIFWNGVSKSSERLMRYNLYYLFDQYQSSHLYRREFSLVLHKFSRFPDFLSPRLDRNGVIHAVNDLLSKEKLSRFILQQELEESAVPIYISITDDKFPNHSFSEFVENSVQHFTQNTMMEAPRPKSRRYYSALVINSWYLQFPGRRDNYLVLPRRVQVSDNAGVILLCMTNLRLLSLKIQDVVNVIMTYNTQKIFHSEIPNCQTFLLDILKALGLEHTIKELGSQVTSYLDEMRSKGFHTEMPIQFKRIERWNKDDVMMWLRTCRLEEVFGTYFQKNVTSGTRLIKLSFPDKDVLGENLRRLYEISSNTPASLLTLRYCLVNIYKCAKDRKTRKGRFKDHTVQIIHKRASEKIKQFIEEQEELLSSSTQSSVSRHVSTSKLYRWVRNIEYDEIQKDENFAYYHCHRTYLKTKLDTPDRVIEDVKNGGRLKMKINVTELSDTLESFWKRKLLARALEIGGYFKKHDFGLFHTAVIVGPWYLEWNTSNYVNIRPQSKIESERTFCVLDIGYLEFTNRKKTNDSVIYWLDGIREKLVDVVVHWNTSMSYSRKTRNCQHFVDHLLKVLGVSREEAIPRGNCLSEYVDDVRRSGIAKIAFKPTKKFFLVFKDVLGKEDDDDDNDYDSDDSDDDDHLNNNRRRSSSSSKRIPYQREYEFLTHRQLDEFVHTLLCSPSMKRSMNKFQKEFPYVYRLLKSFDRAFWLKNFKAKMDMRWRPRSGRDYGDGGLSVGCPFCHPSQTMSIYRM